MHVHPFQLTFEAMIKDTKLVDTRLGVEVRINDANDNAPIFNPQTVEVSILESTMQGQEIVALFSFKTFASTYTDVTATHLKPTYELFFQ